MLAGGYLTSTRLARYFLRAREFAILVHRLLSLLLRVRRMCVRVYAADGRQVSETFPSFLL